MSDMMDMRTDRRRLRTFLVFDLITVLVGVVFILVVWWPSCRRRGCSCSLRWSAHRG